MKVGVGAFMQRLEDARTLAETMVGIGAAYGVATVALLTSMNAPLGCEVGNASEIRESLDILRGGGPQDLTEVIYALGIEMLMAAGVEIDRPAARLRLEAAISSGAAMERFARVIEAQGGDPRVIDDESLLDRADRVYTLAAERPGFITRCDARKVGVAAMRLGAGRERKKDTIDPGVGITVLGKPGDEVVEGTPLARLTYRHPARLQEAIRALGGAWEYGEEASVPDPLIIGRVIPS